MRSDGFDLVEAMLEDVAEDVYVHLAREIVLRYPHQVRVQHLVADAHYIQQFVRFEEAAVVGEDVVQLPFVAGVQVAEVFLESGLERHVSVHVAELLPLVGDLADAVRR